VALALALAPALGALLLVTAEAVSILPSAGEVPVDEALVASECAPVLLAFSCARVSGSTVVVMVPAVMLLLAAGEGLLGLEAAGGGRGLVAPAGGEGRGLGEEAEGPALMESVPLAGLPLVVSSCEGRAAAGQGVRSGWAWGWGG
jgi:hypothetical protein